MIAMGGMVPKLQAPIVLVPGLLGFDRLQVGGWTIASYFGGLPELLRASGNRVLVASPSPTAGVTARAMQLKELLDRAFPQEAVHLFGHSMGGLDCRYLISRLGMAPRVLSLTTIATPHRGSSFADWGIRRFSRVLRPFFDLFNIPYAAFFDLTREHCRRFNEEVPDAPGVRYASIAGRYNGDWLRPEWHLPHSIVTQEEGPNDGVVSLASATYGETTDVWEADHLSLVNCPHLLGRVSGRWQDHTPQYGRLLHRFVDAGF